MKDYDADCLENNIKIYDEFLAEYEKVYEKAGLKVNRFSNVDDLVASYVG